MARPALPGTAERWAEQAWVAAKGRQHLAVRGCWRRDLISSLLPSCSDKASRETAKQVGGFVGLHSSSECRILWRQTQQTRQGLHVCSTSTRGVLDRNRACVLLVL